MLLSLVFIAVIGILLWLFLSSKEGFDTPSFYALNRQWCLLWEQHVEWTRLLIISILSRLPDESATRARLLKTVSAMTEVINRYFGSTISGKFSDLFTEHLTIANKLILAVRDGTDYDNLKLSWFINADNIINFLSQINIYWKREMLKDLFYNHLHMTLNEIKFRVNGNYTLDISTYDSIEKEALKLADLFAEGLVSKFS